MAKSKSIKQMKKHQSKNIINMSTDITRDCIIYIYNYTHELRGPCIGIMRVKYDELGITGHNFLKKVITPLFKVKYDRDWVCADVS